MGHSNGYSTTSVAARSTWHGPAARSKSLVYRVHSAIERCTEYLVSLQHADGCWCGELEGDTILESEYILLLAWLGYQQSPLATKAARYLLEKQLPHGGWSLYPGGDVDISSSVKAYFALKLTGHAADCEPLRRARQAILRYGGADAVNSFTRFYLALLGQISYNHCPAVPPEIVLLPTWMPFHLYRLSAWTRTIVVPLSIMWAYRPVRDVSGWASIRELMIRPPDEWPSPRCPGLDEDSGLFAWHRLFRWLDQGMKTCEAARIRPLRHLALRQAELWMLRRFANSDGLGAIFPPIIWSVVALKCLGYSDHSPQLQYCLAHLESLRIRDGNDDRATVRLEPCKSPVWDTALALRALAAPARQPPRSTIQLAVEWLLDKEVRSPGDWSRSVRAEPSGWFFQYHNAYYPDVDDTAAVLMALHDASSLWATPDALYSPANRSVSADVVCTDGSRWSRHDVRAVRGSPDPLGAVLGSPDPAHRLAAADLAPANSALWLRRVHAACQRAVRWLVAMQNGDGGWGAFDKDNDARFLCYLPFADHNAMIDPSTPDITGRVIEALACHGICQGRAAVDRAVAYLRRQQQSDGSWFGRWGVNYIYGTWQALVGLSRAGVDHGDPAIRRGVQWLLEHQQPIGAWGESPDSYQRPEARGCGPPTASQTAWALMALVAAQRARHPAVVRGIEYLLDQQRDDGSWWEPEFTGTGFPRVFYLRYHLYPIYFPLLALKRWLQAIEQAQGGVTE